MYYEDDDYGYRKRRYRDTYDYSDPGYREMSHSGFGIASFVIGLVAGLLAFLLVLVTTVLETAQPGSIDDVTPLTVFLGYSFIGVLVVDLLGLVLGIIGLCQSRRKKVFAALGVVLCCLVLLGSICLMIVSLLA